MSHAHGTSGQRFIEAVTVSFTQAAGSVTGAVTHEVGRSTIQGTVTASTITGNYQFTLGTCTGSASVSGTASNSRIQFSVPTLASTTCTFFTNGDFLLSR